MSNRRKPSNPSLSMTGAGLLDRQVVIEGQFVSEKASQVVQAIAEYDERIIVGYIPREARFEDDSPAYRLIYEPDDGREPYIMFHVEEDEFDERVLARIIANDQTKNGQTISDLEAYEKSLMRVHHEKYLDSLEEAKDIAVKVLSTRKHKYVIDKDLVIEDGIPHNAAHLDEGTGLPKDGSPGTSNPR